LFWLPALILIGGLYTGDSILIYYCPRNIDIGSPFEVFLCAWLIDVKFWEVPSATGGNKNLLEM